jgi:hypothetical protein
VRDVGVLLGWVYLVGVDVLVGVGVVDLKVRVYSMTGDGKVGERTKHK